MLLHFESQAYLPPVTGAKTENMKQDLLSTKWLKGSEWELFAKNGHKWGKYVNATHSAVEVHLVSLPFPATLTLRKGTSNLIRLTQCDSSSTSLSKDCAKEQCHINSPASPNSFSIVPRRTLACSEHTPFHAPLRSVS